MRVRRVHLAFALLFPVLIALVLTSGSVDAANFNPRFQAHSATGAALSGAKLYFYYAGTTAPLDTYSDSSLSTANTNPVVADSSGWFGDIYLAAEAYKVVLKTSANVTVWTSDNYYPSHPDMNTRIWGVSNSTLSAVQATNTSSGSAITAINVGTGYGLWATGGSGKPAILATGGNTTSGVYSTGGATSGTGGEFIGGAPDGGGISATGTGSGTAMYAYTEGTGYACSCGADTTSPAKSALRLVPQDAAPTSCDIGDLYVSTAGKLYICTAVDPIWTLVGSQT